MLDTTQLDEKRSNLRIQRGGTPAERKQHENAMQALYQQWQRWLADRYAQEFTPAQQAAIYEAAGNPDLDGIYEVEAKYRVYADFARTLLQKG